MDYNSPLCVGRKLVTRKDDAHYAVSDFVVGRNGVEWFVTSEDGQHQERLNLQQVYAIFKFDA